jgi:multidrug efflux pump subunit AcrA (membrane-fusion protein)
MHGMRLILAIALVGQTAASGQAPAPPTARAPAAPIASPGDAGVEERSVSLESSPGAGGDVVIPQAAITAQNIREIPAESEGVLMSLAVREGSRVKAGEVLATIDDRLAKAQIEIAQSSLDAAIEKANDKIEEEYARAAANVAKVDLKRSFEVNQKTPGAISDTEMLKKKLDETRSVLQIEKAQKDQLLAGKDAEVKKAELKAAIISLDRRTIKAPFDGEVQTLYQKESQWVNPGDPILRLVQFDVLHVEGYVRATAYDPIELADRPVTVRVQLARGHEVSLPGKVIYINQSVLPLGGANRPGSREGIYLVRAEIQNKRSGNYWVVRPGLEAEVTIHTSQPPVTETAAVASP